MSLLYEKITAALSDILNIDGSKIGEKSKLVEELGVDSLDAVVLLDFCENEYKIHIPDDDVENLKTVEDIYRYLSEKTGEK